MMKLQRLIRTFALCILIASSWMVSSCDVFHEDLPECRLFVQFKYDYNMLSTDAFHTQVDKVTLYVFSKEGIFLFKQTGEGSALSTGNYRMEVKLPIGEYQFMAWTGVHDSYEVSSLEENVSTIEDLKLKVKRDPSLVINKELEPIWHGKAIDVNFTGTKEQTETIDLVKDTKKIRFVFQSTSQTNGTIDMNDYTYEIIESNGYLNYDNSLLKDDILSYQPYYMEQRESSIIAVELNTMRLMADRKTRFIVTHKITGEKVLDINIINFLAMTEMERYKWGEQEYFDRQDEYIIAFLLNTSDGSWVSVGININGWTYYSQTE